MKKDSKGGRAVEFLLLVALGFSCSYSLLGSFLPSGTLKSSFPAVLFCCAAIILLDLLSRKAVWILAVFSLSAGAILFFYQIFEAESSGLNAFSGMLVQPESYSTVFLCAASAVVSLLAAICSRRRLTIVVFWAAMMAILSFLAYTGHGENLPALLVITGCCATLFCYESIRSGLAKSAGGTRILLRSTAVAMGILTAVLAVSQIGFTGLNAVFGKTKKISILDFTTRMQNSLFSTSGFGDYNPNRLLGLRISMNNNLVMEVQADGPFYLRGRVYDTYTGKNWQAAASSDENDVYHQNLFMASRGSWDGENVLERSRINGLENRIQPLLLSHQISVTTKTDGQKYLFLPSSAGKLDGNLKGSVELRHTYPDYESSRPLPLGTKYSYTYYQPVPEEWKSALDGSVRFSYRSSSENRRVNRSIQAAFGSTDGLTDRTIDLAKNITKDCSNEFQKAQAIQKWLADHCTYTLSPPQPWGGEDFVDFFLFNSRKGYCEHFATAMAMLLRASGVPARFVEGYASPAASGNGLYEVTNAQAHSWVEYYSPLFGFLTADPSPASALPRTYTRSEMEEASSSEASMASSGSSPSSAGSSSAASSSSPESMPAGSGAVSSGSTPGGEGGTNPASWIWAFTSLLILILLPYAGKTGYRALWFAAVRRKSGCGTVLSLYGYFVSVLKKLGFSFSPSDTPLEIAGRVRGHLSFGGVSFDRVTKIYTEVRFGERDPSAGEREELFSFYAELPAVCRKKLGYPRYLLLYPLLH